MSPRRVSPPPDDDGIGTPGPLPPRINRGPDWNRVADLAKNSPGLWVPVKAKGAPAARELASRIRRGDRGCPRALQDERFTAEARGASVYVAWDVQP